MRYPEAISGGPAWHNVSAEKNHRPRLLRFGSCGGLPPGWRGLAVYAVFQTANKIRDNTNQVRQSAHEQRARYALEVAGRWTDPQARELRVLWGALLVKLRHMSEVQRGEYLCNDENIKDRSTVLDVLNCFEEAALAVNIGVADEQTRDIVKYCGWARSGGVLLNHQTIFKFLSI